MVYNAMKLFMEVNPSLYDQCYQNWMEAHDEKANKAQARKDKWDRLAAAGARKRGQANGTTEHTTSPSAKLLPMTSRSGDKLEHDALTVPGQAYPTPAGSPSADSHSSDPLGHERLSRFQDLSIQEASEPGRLGYSQAPPLSSNLGTPSHATSESFRSEWMYQGI